MDYTKVISTVKKSAIAIVNELGGALEYIATKIKQETDAIKTDVAGVKTDVATVKTDVAGVKTDVAGVKTDVAGVGSKVDGATNDIKKSIGVMESETYGFAPTTVRTVKHDNITSSRFVDVVNVSGAGRLSYLSATVGTYQNTECEWRVTIDGKSTTVKDRINYYGNGGSLLFDSQYMASYGVGGTNSDSGSIRLLNVGNDQMMADSSGHMGFFPHKDIAEGGYTEVRVVGRDLGADCPNGKTIFVTKGGVPFSESLHVQCRRVSGDATVRCHVCYSLN